MTEISNKAIFLIVLLFIFKVNSKSIDTESVDWQAIAPKALENDILFPNGMNDVEFFNAVPTDTLRWPNGIVYYTIDPNFPNSALINDVQNNISASIGLDSTGTNCITFKPRTTQTNYANYWTGTGGCTSYVGMIGGQQNISLASGCIYTGIIIHEIMHAIGFWHEQNRSDRDSYVTVNLENIAPENQQWFRKYTSSENRLFASFDLTSIMLYDNYAFSINGEKTIVANNGQPLLHAYLKYALTSLNIQAIRGLYNCTYPTNITTTTPPTTTTTTTSSSSTTKPTTTSTSATTEPTTTTSTTSTATEPTTTTTSTTTQSSVFTCTEDGYFADPSNCEIFYRCVASGTTFTKYQFSCPATTVWSNNQRSCVFGTASNCPSLHYDDIQDLKN